MVAVSNLRLHRGSAGLSLIEVMMSVLLLGVAVVLTGAGTQLMADILRQQRLTETQREVQTALDFVAEDVRSSESVVAVSSDTLVIRVFDARLGYTNPAIFDPATFGTITYRYQDQGGARVLSRNEKFPDHDLNKTILKNSLARPTVAEPLFSPYPFNATPPYSAVTTTVRLELPFDIPRSSYTVVMTRRRVFDE